MRDLQAEMDRFVNQVLLAELNAIQIAVEQADRLGCGVSIYRHPDPSLKPNIYIDSSVPPGEVHERIGR